MKKLIVLSAILSCTVFAAGCQSGGGCGGFLDRWFNRGAPCEVCDSPVMYDNGYNYVTDSNGYIVSGGGVSGGGCNCGGGVSGAPIVMDNGTIIQGVPAQSAPSLPPLPGPIN